MRILVLSVVLLFALPAFGAEERRNVRHAVGYKHIVVLELPKKAKIEIRDRYHWDGGWLYAEGKGKLVKRTFVTYREGDPVRKGDRKVGSYADPPRAGYVFFVYERQRSRTPRRGQ